MTPDEIEFDDLPEVLRLALIDAARREAGVADEPLALAHIAEAAGMPYATAHRRLHVALLKLRRRAEQLDLDPRP